MFWVEVGELAPNALCARLEAENTQPRLASCGELPSTTGAAPGVRTMAEQGTGPI